MVVVLGGGRGAVVDETREVVDVVDVTTEFELVFDVVVVVDVETNCILRNSSINACFSSALFEIINFLTVSKNAAFSSERLRRESIPS